MKIVKNGGKIDCFGTPKTILETKAKKYVETIKKENFLTAAKGLFGEKSETYETIKRKTLKELVK